MTKKTRVLLFSILLLGIIGLFSYQTKSITTNKKDVKYNVSGLETNANFYSTILKVDENGDRLENVEFILKAYNDVFEYVATEWQEGYNYNYYFDVNDNRVSSSALYSMLSPVQKNAVESITTFRDIVDNFEYSCSGVKSAESSDCSIFLPTALIIEETEVPAGYVKDKKIIPGTIRLKYEISDYSEAQDLDTGEWNYTEESLSSQVELIGIKVFDDSCDGIAYDYGDVEIEELLGLEPISTSNVTNINPEKGTANIREDKGQACSSIYWENQKGNVSLTATAYVNNGNSITTKPNQNIAYKVVVENNGTVDAIDNIIKAEVPEGFIYVPGTASYDGEYKDGYIEWNVSRIKRGRSIELSYTLFAPKEVAPGVDYTSKAIIQNFAMDNNVESNKTMVRLALNNPVTMSPLGIIIAILLMAAGAFTITYRSYMLQQLEQQQ